jgi:hypothetical protein
VDILGNAVEGIKGIPVEDDLGEVTTAVITDVGGVVSRLADVLRVREFPQSLLAPTN